MPPTLPQPMREAVRLERVEALEVEHRLDEAVAGRVAVGDGEDVGAEGGSPIAGSAASASQKVWPMRSAESVGCPSRAATR